MPKKRNQITINDIPDARYAELKAEAAGLKISLNNLVRRRLGIPDAKPGNPTGNHKRAIQQPKGKKRGVKRTKEEIEQAKQTSEGQEDARDFYTTSVYSLARLLKD